MKRNSIALSTLVLLLGLFSCTTSDNAVSIQKVDSLLTVVERADSLFLSIDSAKVAESFSSFESTSKDFGKYFTDEYDSNWTTITSYANIKKPLRNYLRQYHDLRHELDYSRAQLLSLKQSLKTDVIPEDSIEYYVDSETGAVFMLEQSLSFIVNEASMELARYDSLQPVMLSLLEMYRKRNPAGLHKRN
jgi:hypothetical protein